jgi:hypothetical protein
MEQKSQQRKRVLKVQEIVQKWLDTIALPQMISSPQIRGCFDEMQRAC